MHHLPPSAKQENCKLFKRMHELPWPHGQAPSTLRLTPWLSLFHIRATPWLRPFHIISLTPWFRPWTSSIVLQWYWITRWLSARAPFPHMIISMIPTSNPHDLLNSTRLSTSVVDYLGPIIKYRAPTRIGRRRKAAYNVLHRNRNT